MAKQTVVPTDLYRLPWSLTDNSISWLEPTTRCNLRCEGCYRKDTAEHKSFEEVRGDLETFRRFRRSDSISIAGGEPLMHPQILDIVALVKQMGWKPIVNSNAVALNEKLLAELKKAGVYGFTFHIDTSQKRPRVSAKTETELNEVRLHYAKMLAAAGDIACSFNATISERTLPEVNAMADWARQHADIVQTMVFILFRSPMLTGEFSFFAGGREVTFGTTYKDSPWGGERVLHAADLIDEFRRQEPSYAPAAYLNGTANPASFKWLLAERVVHGGETVGYVSPRFMELAQVLYHLRTGRYLSYISPSLAARGMSATALVGLVDGSSRRIFGRLLARTLRRPWTIGRRACLQSIMIIQPVNIDEGGRMDMCDSCPDITVHQGKLVWSCRLEELNEFGVNVTAVPRVEAVGAKT
jgi:hypothetical protein